MKNIHKKTLAARKEKQLFNLFFFSIILFPLGLFESPILANQAIFFLILLFSLSLFPVRIGTSFLLYYAIFVSWIFLSFLINSTSNVEYYDFFSEIIRYFAIFIILISVYNITCRYTSDDLPKNLFSIFTIALLLQFLVTLIGYWGGQAILETWFEWEKNRLTPLPMIFSGIPPRITGTFENPNFLAFFCAQTFFFALRANIKGSGLIRALIIILSIILILASSSRAGILSVVVGFFANWPLLSIVLFLPMLFFSFGELPFERLNALLIFQQSLTQDIGFSDRYFIILRSFDLIASSPIFGYGSSPIPVTDNQILIYLLRYGIPIILILSIGWGLLAIELSRRFGRRGVKDLVVFSGILLPFMISGQFFDNFRLLVLASVIFLGVMSVRFLQKKNELEDMSSEKPSQEAL